MADSRTIDTLIVVCCHAIWIGEPKGKAFNEKDVENGWLIESFQKGETSTFVKHIQAGLDKLHEKHNAILVFSGGPTKPKRSELTEAGTYVDFIIANMATAFHENSDRIFAESFATDSFQNILFSLLSYPSFVQQCYIHRQRMRAGPESEISTSPHQLIVVGHAFKRARFEELHLPALRFPTEPSRFKYIGIDPPFDEQRMQEIKEGDAKRGYGAWKDDLYGTCLLLAAKRVARGWTQDRINGLTKCWRENLTKLQGIDQELLIHFESAIAFVEGTEKHFPARTPWS